MIPRLQAEESLRFAYVQRIATGAGGIVASQNKKLMQSAWDEYQRLMKGLNAQMTGTVGQEVDAHGNIIARSGRELRQWLFDEGGIHA